MLTYLLYYVKTGGIWKVLLPHPLSHVRLEACQVLLAHVFYHARLEASINALVFYLMLQSVIMKLRSSVLFVSTLFDLMSVIDFDG